MSETIPDDILFEAADIAMGFATQVTAIEPLQKCIARALVAERERAAKACAEYRLAFAEMPESVAKIAAENASHLIENAITHLCAIRTPSTGEEQ